MARVFLSHADSDADTAALVSQELDRYGIEVGTWPPADPESAIVEDVIERADVFVALLSRDALTSPLCHRQRELAAQRLRRDQPPGTDPGAPGSRTAPVSVYVLDIGDCPYHDGGFLRGGTWISLKAPGDPAARRQAAESLAHQVGARVAQLAPAPAGRALARSPVFRNRGQELSQVLRSLTLTDGQHFWLIIAPPQLGKTWFLDKLAAEVDRYAATAIEPGGAPAEWAKTIVDLREMPAAVRSDARAVLGLMFRCDAPTGTSESELIRLAERILDGAMPWLCLIDSAELLTVPATRTLRDCLARLYDLLREHDSGEVYFAVVAASRSEEEWKGITPEEFEPLELTQFRVDVVRRALQDDLARLPVTVGPERLREYAALVHGLTEGLPALLVPCLNWTAWNRWLRVEDRLKPHFETLAGSYIANVLLSAASLFSQQSPASPAQEAILAFMLQALAPYRMITQMHIRHCSEENTVLQSALASYPGEPLKPEDQWAALRGTALLLARRRALWIEIYPPIRRLIFRHFYSLDDSRAAAHRQAESFLEFWTRDQSGMEQVVGMIEGLWHQAEALRAADTAPQRMDEHLTESAVKYVERLRPSAAFSMEELRDFATLTMRDDRELQAAVSSVHGLFDRLLHIVEEGTGATS
jgi:TIR domain